MTEYKKKDKDRSWLMTPPLDVWSGLARGTNESEVGSTEWKEKKRKANPETEPKKTKAAPKEVRGRGKRENGKLFEHSNGTGSKEKQWFEIDVRRKIGDKGRPGQKGTCLVLVWRMINRDWGLAKQAIEERIPRSIDKSRAFDVGRLWFIECLLSPPVSHNESSSNADCRDFGSASPVSSSHGIYLPYMVRFFLKTPIWNWRREMVQFSTKERKRVSLFHPFFHFHYYNNNIKLSNGQSCNFFNWLS